MVVFGAVVGLLCFLLQGCAHLDGNRVSVSMAMLALLAAMFMIPANGPAWSLFFEYIGNILYGLLVHRLSTRMLTAVTALLGVALVWMTVGDFVGWGMFGVGWTLDGVNFWGGLARMLFPRHAPFPPLPSRQGEGRLLAGHGRHGGFVYGALHSRQVACVLEWNV